MLCLQRIYTDLASAAESKPLRPLIPWSPTWLFRRRRRGARQRGDVSVHRQVQHGSQAEAEVMVSRWRHFRTDGLWQRLELVRDMTCQANRTVGSDEKKRKTQVQYMFVIDLRNMSKLQAKGKVM